MTPLDARNLARLISTLEEVHRANNVAELHLAAGCPEAAAELRTARVSIGHALRIAQGPARDYVPDDVEHHHMEEAGT